jgi:plastocyanin
VSELKELRMFVSCVGRAVMSVGVLVVLLGATTSGPSVTIADGALTPPSVVVPAGGSVLWTNRGTRQHEIVAIGRTFPSFSLAPEGTRSVPFMQPGKYPYLLDGAVKGTVFVVGSGGGGGTGGTGGGGQSPASRKDCVTIYRYDVRVAVHREVMPADNAAGTVSDWKASWVAPMYLDRCAGMKLQITARSAEMSGNKGMPIYLRDGQFDRTFDWNDTTDIGQGGVPPCHFTYASHLPARMSITVQFGGSSANPEEIHFDFLADQDSPESAASKADRARALDAWRAACDPKRSGPTVGIYTYIPKNGIPGIIGDKIGTIGDSQLHLIFTMPPNSPVEASIIDSLLAGKGFNYDTEMQLFQGGILQSNYSKSSSRVRATVSFGRLEN